MVQGGGLPDLNIIVATQLITLGHLSLKILQDVSHIPNTTTNLFRPAIDESKTYPKLDEFLEPYIIDEPGRGLRPVLTKLRDSGYYRIDDVYLCSEDHLVGLGIARGEAQWVLRKVTKSVLEMQ
jgi:hypothetical protein